MAERKLNLSVPLLSTRRMQQKTAVSVRRNKLTANDSSSLPRLVPDQDTEAASVPFTWEQAPGRLKGNDVRPQVQVFTPCPPPGKVNLTRLQCSKGEEVEESEDVFSDAPDTLSPKDSFSVNPSLSSGVVETRKPPTLSEDRDFMLNRFLPAAKAMALEQPRYASSRKPSTFMPEPTIQMRNSLPQEKRLTSNRYDEVYNHQDVDDEESEEEDNDQVSEYAYLSKRGCGMLLPQFCFKDSLSMLNTVTSPTHDQVNSSKVAQLKSRFQSVKKLAFDSVSKHKLNGKVGEKFNSESNLSVASRSSPPYRHSRSMSPFRSETRKETENLRANRLNRHIRNISRSQDLLYPKSNCSTSSNVIISPEDAEKIADADAFENISIRSAKMVTGDESGKINGGGVDRFSLAPPSPKKPSESWLFHNLTSQNPSSSIGFPFNPQNQGLTEKTRNRTNWETLVKTSHTHRDHIRYSQELLAHTSHQSKT